MEGAVCPRLRTGDEGCCCETLERDSVSAVRKGAEVSALFAVAIRLDPERFNRPPAMPSRDLRERRPLSCVPVSTEESPSLDLGVRWKKEGVRRDFGLVPASVVAAMDCEPALDGDCSASLSFCPDRISLLREATLARRSELDLVREAAVDVSVSAAFDPVKEASSADRGSEEVMTSSIGSATVHCIETSLVDEPREAVSLSLPRLGLRTASAATSASSCMRGLRGDLGVSILSLLSPLMVDTKL